MQGKRSDKDGEDRKKYPIVSRRLPGSYEAYS